ncbi:MAG: DUF1588 domain-containing protein [Planctomycetales bacterium]|nr:DUF1588 domain-containing protein [Planctomycetales bacterium]
MNFGPWVFGFVSNFDIRISSFAAVFAWFVAAPALAAEPDAAGFRSGVAPFLEQHCFDCHGPDAAEGKLTLHTLDGDLVAGQQSETWIRVLEKLALGEMPPEDSPQPDSADVQRVTGWIRGQLQAGGHAFEDKLLLPAFGNYVSHDELFGRPPTGPSYSPPRFWRIRPDVYQAVVGQLAGQKLTQPFGLSAPGGGFADYATLYKLDGPSVELLLGNARAAAANMTRFKIENGKIARDGWGAPDEVLRVLDPANEQPSDEQIAALIRSVYQRVLQRDATDEEREQLLTFTRGGIERVGRLRAVRNTLAAVLLKPEALYRVEMGHGQPDEHGRVRLSPREIAYAVSYALTDQPPDAELFASLNRVVSGPRAEDAGSSANPNESTEAKSDARPDGHPVKQVVTQQVRRILDDPKIDTPRVMGFFHEYFGYTKALDVFKDEALNPQHRSQVLVDDTDRLVRYILDQDRDVLRELLTTNLSFVNAGYDKGRMVHLSYNLPLDWKRPEQQPVALPGNQRAGILTQPSWLVAHSGNFDNDVVRRGKWIRERLLGGTIPDLPITVDAQLPDEPHNTLRERMRVTREEYCWQCHRRMNPLGESFENFDHFGRWRTSEIVLDREATAANIDEKGNSRGPVMRRVPADASSEITRSGDAKIDGPARDSIELIHRLADSDRVRQVFVRHAFRYWMGRNETPADAATLQAADRAYVESDGSMKALIVSLLTSDSFLYRKSETRVSKSETNPNAK